MNSKNNRELKMRKRRRERKVRFKAENQKSIKRGRIKQTS